MPSRASQSKKRRLGVPSMARTEEDEERDLEARLFGSRKQPTFTAAHDNSDDEGETGLGWVKDDALFTVDIPAAGAAGDENAFNHFGSDISEDEMEPTLEFPEELELDEQETTSQGSLWHDPADNAVSVSLQSNKRLRKLARGRGEEDQVSGNDLSRKLREQFERIHPKPQWASRRVGKGIPTIQKLLSSTSSFVSAGDSNGRAPLPSTFIDIQRLRNANEQNPTTGSKEATNAGSGVVDFAWHPSTRLSVMAVAGGDRRVRFFNIDGHTNSALLTLHIPSLPLTRSTFHPSGSSLLLTGSRPFYYTYDLAAQVCVRSPRNLFGSAPSPTSPQSLDRHKFSPDGSLLAVAGRRGCVTVLEWGNGGSTGVVVGELRSGRGGSVADLAWSEDGSRLSVLGGRNGSEVEVWDVGERRVVRQWKDDAAFGGLLMRQNGDYTAIGSSTGIVSLYRSAGLSASANTSAPDVEPHKSLEHLTTPITSMAFHPGGELFVSASSAKKDALKLYHLPSGTAFSNWPTLTTPLGRVSCTGFSSGGDYMAIGNTKGSVLLWSLKHYAN